MIDDLINFSNTEFGKIRTEATKLHPTIFQPITRISQINDSYTDENLAKQYKSNVEPMVNKFKKDLKQKMIDYLCTIASELILLGFPLGLNLETSEEVFTIEEFREIYNTSDFFAKQPFNEIINAVEEQFKFTLSMKPFWEIQKHFKHNNNSFHIYPTSDNVSYIKQIVSAIDKLENNNKSNIDKFRSFIKRKDAIPYKTVTDFESTGVYPFYNSSNTFDKVMGDIEMDLMLHEVLFCIKTNEELYKSGRAFNLDINDYL